MGLAEPSRFRQGAADASVVAAMCSGGRKPADTAGSAVSDCSSDDDDGSFRTVASSPSNAASLPDSSPLPGSSPLFGSSPLLGSSPLFGSPFLGCGAAPPSTAPPSSPIFSGTPGSLFSQLGGTGSTVPPVPLKSPASSSAAFGMPAFIKFPRGAGFGVESPVVSDQAKAPSLAPMLAFNRAGFGWDSPLTSDQTKAPTPAPVPYQTPDIERSPTQHTALGAEEGSLQ